MEISLQNNSNEEASISGTEIVPFLAESGSSPAPPSRYEQQKRRDWRTFLHYLKNYDPPLTLGTCFDDGAFVIKYLKHFDQFGKTKVHLSDCAHSGHPNSPAPPCDCPVKQAWGSQDSLIGRLRAAYEENGGSSESNPFGAKAVREYLREVKDEQAKSRGVEYGKKKRSRPGSGTVSVSTSMAAIGQVVDCNSGIVSGDGGVRSTSVVGIPQVDNVNSGDCSAAFNGSTSAVGNAEVVYGSARSAGDGSTSMAGIPQVVDGSSVSASDRSTLRDGIAQVVDAISGEGGGASTSHSSGVVTVEGAMKSRFNTETLVEVNFRDKQCHSAWFPATILKVINHDLFLVGYNGRFSDEECYSRAFMDAQRIRPSPPEYLEGKDFHVAERVDAYYDCGWWSGKVTEVLSGNRYIVHFEHQKIGREFNKFELRCHMEWINSEWVSDSWGIDPKHKEVGGTDQAQLSLVFHTADGLNIKTQKTKLSTARDNIKSSPLCGKSRKGEVSESSYPENEILTSTIPSPSEELSAHPAPNFGEEKSGIVLDCDGEISDSSLILTSPPESEIPTSIFPCPSEDLIEQPAPKIGLEKCRNVIECDGEMSESISILTTHPEKVKPTCTTIFPSEGLSCHLAPESFSFLITHPEKETATNTTLKPSEGSSDHLDPNFGQEKNGTDKSGSCIVIDDYSLSPLSNIGGEQCDSSKTQVLQNNLDHSSPHNINGSDQQKCRRGGKGWCCREMASSGKQHCEKHLKEQMIRNEKRRKRRKQSGEQSRFPLEPFVPPTVPAVQQPCKRNGTRWHCHEMSLPGKRYCEKHQLRRENYNINRRKRPIEQNRFVGPLLPTYQQQCRRTGSGWRCHEMASPGKRYCEKHQLVRDTYNEKRRKRPRENSCSMTSGEKGNSNGNHLLSANHQQCSGEGMAPMPNEGEIIQTDQGHLSHAGDDPLITDLYL